MDKSAMGHDFIAKVDKHDSQKDYKTGFGGKFGVQTDRVDKSALGWEHVEKVDKHNSQQGLLRFVSDIPLLIIVGEVTLSINFCPSDYKDGFGGKFGVQTDRQDKSALGWDHIEKVNQHESQKGENCFNCPAVLYKSCLIDYKTGFGGKFGVGAQNDKSALGWEHHEKVDKHESQKGDFILFILSL